METTVIDFLKEQVERLNALLGSYQQAYPGHSAQSEGGVAALPWDTDRELLSPLLTEYDRVISRQETDLHNYATEITQLRQRVQEIITDNERLTSELRRSVEAPGGILQYGSDLQVGDSVDVEDHQLLYNFQQQLQLAAREKEATEEKWRAASQEIDRLEKELEGEKDSHQWRVVEQQAHQVKEQYVQTVAALNTEIGTLQTDLRKARSEITVAELESKERKQAVTDLQRQLMWKGQENADCIVKEGMTDTRMLEIRQTVDEHKHKLSLMNRENEELKQEKTTLETRLTDMQRRTFQLEEKESDAVMQVRDAVQMVENSILEKNQIEVELRQKEAEVNDMQEVVNKLINEAGIRTRQEVDVVKQQSNERITKVTGELHALEMNSSEQEAQIERLVREKRSVESELEKLYKEGIVSGSKREGTFEDLNRRAIDSERRKDEAELRADTLSTLLKREQMNTDKLKEQLEMQLTGMTDRHKTMEIEFENLNDDRLQTLNELDKVKRKLQMAVQEKEVVRRKYTKETAILESTESMKVREFEVKLQSTEDANRSAMTEVRKLLNSQQRMSVRWKTECTTITQTFEVKVVDLRSEVSMLKRRNEALTALLNDSQQKSAEAERIMSEYTRNVGRMEDRVREAEHRAAAATRKVSVHAVRERQLNSEREMMLLEMGRSQRDATRSPGRSQRDLSGSPRNASRFSLSGRLGESLTAADLSNGHVYDT